jgi:hypothetical protein
MGRNRLSWRNVLREHHEILRAAVSFIHLEDERHGDTESAPGVGLRTRCSPSDGCRASGVAVVPLGLAARLWPAAVGMQELARSRIAIRVGAVDGRRMASTVAQKSRTDFCDVNTC